MRRALPWLVFAALVAFIVYKLHTTHFNGAAFAESVKTADFRLVAVAVLLIYSNNVLRAFRWAIFLRPAYRATGRHGTGVARTPWYKLIGTQFIGFAGLAVLGRLGELVRPILVARRTGLPFPSQVALVTVERVFDLGAFGTIFALNLSFSPSLQALPYLHKAGYTIAGLTVAIVVFVLAVRLAGELIARSTAALVGMVSKPAGVLCAEKILGFRNGLNVIGSFGDFAWAAALSFALWLTVTAAYVLTLRAFAPPVHLLRVSEVIVLMGFSIAGSALPIPGGSGAWAGNTFALGTLFAIPPALAASAGLMVWLVTTISVIPAGLVFARWEGVSLLQVAQRSEDGELDAV